MTVRQWLKMVNDQSPMYQVPPISTKSPVSTKMGFAIALTTFAVGAGLVVARERMRMPRGKPPHERGSY